MIVIKTYTKLVLHPTKKRGYYNTLLEGATEIKHFTIFLKKKLNDFSLQFLYVQLFQGNVVIAIINISI